MVDIVTGLWQPMSRSASMGNPWSIFSSSFLIRILCPLSTVLVRLIPSILQHSSAHVLLVVPTIALPSIGIPKITSTSCNVIVVSPCGKWKVWVSGRHRLTKAVIKLWSISLHEVLYNPSNPTLLTMLTTRSSTTIRRRFRNSSLRPWHASAPRSYTW